MSDKTAIEWTDATWNPILGCTRVSPGCDGCYAITNANIRQANPNPKVSGAYADLVHRNEAGVIDWNGRVNLLDDRLDQPLRWKRPRRIFVNAQSDLFHESVPDEFVARIFAVMAATPRHTFQILTKRHGRMRSLLRSGAFHHQIAVAHMNLTSVYGFTTSCSYAWPLPNVWLGVSVEDQKWADIRVPVLLNTPAAVRWLSCEPLLGPVDLRRGRYAMPSDGEELGTSLDGIDWVVVGGESGAKARPMAPDWARFLRDQCGSASVPFLFKQWGGRSSKAGGRELDGRTWDEMPGRAA